MYETVEQARQALEKNESKKNCLSKGDITEIKAFNAPPVAVCKTMTCMYKMLHPEVKVSDITWKNCKEMLADSNLLVQVINIGKNGISSECFDGIREFVSDESLSEEHIRKISAATAGVMSWMRAIALDYRIKQCIAHFEQGKTSI